MSEPEIHNKIKSIVHSFLPDAQVLLFGSRATGNADKDSDYDLLVVTKEPFLSKEKLNYQSQIRKALVWAFDVPFDVFVKTMDDIDRYKDAKAHIIYYALKDAITI